MDSPFTRLDLVGLPTAGVPICVCLRDIGRVIIATITMERVYISYVGKDADVTKVIVAIQSSFRSEMCFRHLSIDALRAGKRVYRSTRLHIVCVCKVRQGPRHKHHCGNEHDEHSFREFHTSKNLSVRNRRTSSMGRANQTRFTPKGMEIYAPLAAKTSLYRRPPVSAYGCILFWIPEIRIPKFPKPNSRNRIPPKSRGTTGIRGGMHRFSFGDFSLHYRAWRSLSQGLPGPSNLHAPYRGSFLKYAGIISSALRLSSPVWVSEMLLGSVYHNNFIVSILYC